MWEQVREEEEVVVEAPPPSPTRAPTPMFLVLLDGMHGVHFSDCRHTAEWLEFDPQQYVEAGGGDVQVRQLQVYLIYY